MKGRPRLRYEGSRPQRNRWCNLVRLGTAGSGSVVQTNVIPLFVMAGGMSAKQQRIKEQMRQGSPPRQTSPTSPLPVLPQPRYGHSLLEVTCF